MVDFFSLRQDGNRIVPYSAAWEFQKILVERRIRDEIPDTFLFVEHPPTITRGRGLQRKPGGEDDQRSVPIGSVPEGTQYFQIERGGDLTWHGPGQLVVYPIVKLDGKGFGPDHDVVGFLRKLEKVFGGWFAMHGLVTESRENATGIWVEVSGRPARKIASIGIAVKKWVTYHGIGLNIANDLSGFRGISPCGFDPEVMTTLSVESPEFGEGGWSEKVRDAVELEISSIIMRDAVVYLQEV
jgi:lipoate-protein ligase B